MSANGFVDEVEAAPELISVAAVAHSQIDDATQLLTHETVR